MILDIRYVLSRKDLSLVKKETGVKIITIDDPEDKRLEADIAFYPPVPQLETMDWTDYKAKIVHRLGVYDPQKRVSSKIFKTI